MIKKIFEFLMKEIKTTDIPKLKHTFSYAFLTILFWQIFQKFFKSWEVVSVICLVLVAFLSVIIELLEKRIFNQPIKKVYEGIVFALIGFFLGSFTMLYPLIALLFLIACIFESVGIVIGVLGILALVIYILVKIL